MIHFFLTFLLLFTLPQAERKAIYSRLEKQSLAKQLAFSRLFPDTEEGKKAYKQACLLLQGKEDAPLPPLPSRLLDSLISAVAAHPDGGKVTFSAEELELIQTLSERFENRKLAGNKLTSEEEILKLPPEEIDLARALLISQGSDVARLEAIFDIMALHIQARLRNGAGHLEMIEATTNFIFDEMGFRFPPKSSFTEEIDKFTSLPSVVDGRKGVCLGVSILYLAIAQRLGIPLEVITPPGHIYVRYEGAGGPFNIETTARGVHLPDRAYLNLEYLSLQHRSIREVVGMAHMNEAAAYWQNEQYETALSFYKKALPYMSEDPLLHELMGYIYLLLGQEAEAKSFFAKGKLKPTSFAHDWLQGKCDGKAIALLFKKESKERNKLIAYRKEIEKMLVQWPEFKGGWFYLAACSLELGRTKDAMLGLEKYHSLYPSNPMVEYLLTEMYLDRGEYGKGWKHQKLVASLFPNAIPPMIEEQRVKLLEKSYPD